MLILLLRTIKLVAARFAAANRNIGKFRYLMQENPRPAPGANISAAKRRDRAWCRL